VIVASPSPDSLASDSSERSLLSGSAALLREAERCVGAADWPGVAEAAAAAARVVRGIVEGERARASGVERAPARRRVCGRVLRRL